MEKQSKILLIDDSGTIRAIIKVWLVGMELAFVEASAGDEGLTVARIHRPDLIIVDFKMPTMNGFEFVRQVRLDGDPGLKKVPILMLTASAKEATFAQQALAAGVNRLLPKPIDGADLQAAVRTFLPR